MLVSNFFSYYFSQLLRTCSLPDLRPNTNEKKAGEEGSADEEEIVLTNIEDEELDTQGENQVECEEEGEEEGDEDDEEFDDYESMLESMRNVLGKTSGKKIFNNNVVIIWVGRKF